MSTCLSLWHVPPSYPPAAPFLRKEKNASPLPLHSFPPLLSRVPCYLIDNTSSKLPTRPPFSPHERRIPCPPSFYRRKPFPSISPPCYMQLLLWWRQRHMNTPSCARERERERNLPCPFYEDIQLHPHECLPHSNIAICPTLIGTWGEL